MLDLRKLKAEVLASGRVGDQELDRICRELYAEGRLDEEVIEFLAEVRREARTVCPSFEELFAEAVKHNVLACGSITADRVAWLRRILLARGPMDEGGKKLLWQLKRATRQVSPEFRRLYEECVG